MVERAKLGLQFFAKCRELIPIVACFCQACLAQHFEPCVQNAGADAVTGVLQCAEGKGAVPQFPDNAQNPALTHKIQQGHDGFAGCGAPNRAAFFL